MALPAEIKQQISSLWNKFWAGGIANPLTAIEQMSYLIFMKRLEDLDNLHAKRASQRNDSSYTSIFKDHENCKWSYWKHFNADAMLNHVKDIVFEFIKGIRNGEDTLFSQYMKDAVFVISKAQLLQEAVTIIDKINITAQNQDVQGDIYEHLLGQLKTAGKNGQFRTPRHIIRMMVTLIDPMIGEKVCDPACGTAGFLICAYEHILAANTSSEIVECDANGVLHNLVGDKIVDKAHWNLLRRETFYGFEIDSTMIRIGLMNMILHGIEHPNIRYSDSVSKSFEHKESYDVVLANPPFTGFVDESTISDSFTVETTKTELLFLELMYNILHKGGRCAVIVPDGVISTLTNAHVKARRLIIENCDLQAVIAMPPGVFYPYSGVSTAVLIFVKASKTEKVWFYEMTADGYTLDQKRDFIDGKGDIPNIIEMFRAGRLESKKSFLVDVQQIRENDYSLSLSRYARVEHKAILHREPSDLLSELEQLQIEISKELEKLKKLV